MKEEYVLMKKFALYLPQFHETVENNKWWGKGFTEWTHVKNAKALFKEHKQPLHPSNNNYYNLINKETVNWQVDLAKKYGVDGFIYYHYYFTGKLLLNKPAENLLQWREIEFPFFFCWANHTWYQAINGKRKVLIEQKYGDYNDWKKHFEYLLPFFKDPRYEKKHNKPVFMIYNSDFKEKNDMIECWNKECIANGFNGIYIIETYTGTEWNGGEGVTKFYGKCSSKTEAIYLREPNVSTQILRDQTLYSPERVGRLLKRIISRKIFPGLLLKYSGTRLYKLMRKYEFNFQIPIQIYHGIFFNWDNTPRHSSYGYIITPPAENEFSLYAEKIQGDDYIIINAWNEWAEGMILEPTEEYGVKYLNWIKKYLP